jgi:hypothetical protein
VDRPICSLTPRSSQGGDKFTPIDTGYEVLQVRGAGSSGPASKGYPHRENNLPADLDVNIASAQTARPDRLLQ